MQGTRKEEGSVTKSDLIGMVAEKLHLPKGKAEGSSSTASSTRWRIR